MIPTSRGTQAQSDGRAEVAPEPRPPAGPDPIGEPPVETDEDDATGVRRIVRFIVEVDRLKAVIRKTRPVGLDRYENAAEHSWQVCLLALLMARHARESVDVHRVIEMLLVHDIPEVDVGDRIVYTGRDAARAEAEDRAARRLFGLLPPAERDLCLERWREFETRESAEAKFAYAVDRLMPLLHNLASDGLAWRENRIPAERVLAINAAIGDVLPLVWSDARASIYAFVAAGVFDFEQE